MANLLLNIAARGAGAGLSVFGTAFTSTFSSVADSCVDRLKKGCVCPHPTECGCIGKYHVALTFSTERGKHGGFGFLLSLLSWSVSMYVQLISRPTPTSGCDRGFSFVLNFFLAWLAQALYAFSSAAKTTGLST